MKHIGKLWGIAFFLIGLGLVWNISQEGGMGPIKVPGKKMTSGPGGLGDETSGDQSEGLGAPLEDPEFDENPMARVAKSAAELRKEIDGVCKSLTEKLVSQKLSNRAAAVSFNFHEKKHGEMLFSQMIRGCFTEDKKAGFKVEIDVFSSEFAGRAQDQIQLQVSAFDFKSNNKIFETGIQFELSVPQVTQSESETK